MSAKNVKNAAAASRGNTAASESKANSSGSKSASTQRGKRSTAGNKSAGSGKQKETGKKSGNTKNTSESPVNTRALYTERDETEKANPMIFKEAVLWMVLAVCILILISYMGIGGYLGEVIADVSFGVFGIAAYLFPFLLFIASAFLISNKGNHIAAMKFASSVGLYICICSFAALFAWNADGASEIIQLYDTVRPIKAAAGLLADPYAVYYVLPLALWEPVWYFLFFLLFFFF